MLRITLAVITLVVVSFLQQANADQDLDSLLGELTFGDSNQELMSSALMPESPQADALAPAPTQSAPPANLSRTQQLTNRHDGELAASPDIPAHIPESPPPVMPTPLAEPTINFNQYFAEGGMGDDCVTPAYPPTPHRAHGSRCDAPVVCRPHQPPRLPPPSTMLQYMETDNCYSNIWDGFAAERQRRCEHHHKHIHGTCDCFTKGKHNCGCHGHSGCHQNACACEQPQAYR